MRCLGLMSGTSADGVDAVLADFRGSPNHPQWDLIRHVHRPYPEDLRRRVISAGQGEPGRANQWLDLTEAITEAQATAARSCDPHGEAVVVGCHGQTVWHRPPTSQQRGASWQLLQAPLLAQLLDRPVVHDFRAADLALGGQGAPLVPKADAALLGGTKGWRALLNLGGIANLTLIPPCCGPERDASVQGWDCGPANSLIDLAVQQFSNGTLLFDRGGAMAQAGYSDETKICRWLQEPYFQSPPPKSTGRELFGRANLQQRLNDLGRDCSSQDAVATLTSFSAAVVAQDLEQLMQRDWIRPLELIVAGGGRHNPVLMDQLQQRCRGLQLISSQALGLPVEAREALVFALLAWWHQRKHPANAPSITGASRESVLGVLVHPG
ncbi:anhydro-N-acetylmuramic acid kinase [Synechococcus sp. BL107]|uniref:anhydro-N-acetylmuramic acid kinase n=1 Tax=Synechococcus sp. BL107 TaxID=313625 RepID=UPI000567577C|nr:anhydro-N-acetylmuramic acid kinase [Synechococcus sp. BL107]